MRNKWLTQLLMLLVFPACCYAQIWSLPAKGIYISASYTGFQYREGIDTTGSVVKLPVEMRDNTIQLFAQYGVTDKLTLQVKLPYRIVSSEGDLNLFNSDQSHYLETGNLSAFGNIEFGGFYEIVTDKPIVSVSFFAEANTSEHNYLDGLQTGFDTWSFKPGAGVGWSTTKSWLSMYLAGDIRSNNYSSAVTGTLEAGYRPVNYFYLAGDILLNKSLLNGSGCDCNNQYTYLYQNDQQYAAIGFKAGFIAGGWGMNLGLGGAFYARNLPVAAVPTIGVQYKNF